MRRKILFHKQVPLRFCLLFIASAISWILITGQPAEAQMGECADCHTMHNSQGALPMRYDTSATPLPQLLRGDCFGCHAQGIPSAIVTVGASRIPQVYHSQGLPGVDDLAGGNFGYIDATKASTGGAAEGKGHNITALTGAEGTLLWAPGGIRQSSHFGPTSYMQSDKLSCSSEVGVTRGCHGHRNTNDPVLNPEGITGAHHNNQAGSLNPGPAEARTGYGYRFLVGTKGYEDTDWQFSLSASDHNEYFGRTTPTELACSSTQCHANGGVRPPNGTMSEFCATCHGNFHTTTVGAGNDTIGNSTGVGTGASPWLRHPADYALPASGDYLGYGSYNLTAPIARTGAVPAGSSNTFTAGSDAVMCLSCHVAHGSQYSDMLRFDYTLMDIGAGGPASGTGCFACHTSKD